jgi:hypothetical protein
MSNSRKNPVLTDKQAETLRDFQARSGLTVKQQEEMNRLLVLQENSKKIILSDGCIEYLMEVYAWETAGKVSVDKEVGIEAFERGKATEEDSITLLSRVDKRNYVKNTERFNNEFLTGEPDVVGEDVIYDTKGCKDYPTFLKKINNGLDAGNEEQIQGYGELLGIKNLYIAYCLPNYPFTMLNDLKRRLFYKGEYVTEESPEFLDKWNKFEHSLLHDDLPPQKRVHKVQVEPMSEHFKQQLYDRVKVCRDWLCDFHERFSKL